MNMRVASCLALISLPLFSQGNEECPIAKKPLAIPVGFTGSLRTGVYPAAAVSGLTLELSRICEPQPEAADSQGPTIPLGFATIPQERRKAPVVRRYHFGIGGGLTASSLRNSIKNLTGGELGRGFFAELRRKSAPDASPTGGFGRYRLAYNDWGDQRVLGLLNANETAHVQRWTASMGLGLYVSNNNLAGWYVTIEPGFTHWEIKSSLPPLRDLKFMDFTLSLLMGFEAFHFFFEYGLGIGGVRDRIRSRVPDFNNSGPNAPLGYEGYYSRIEKDYCVVFFLGYRF
jgi:hypothetical protein